MKKRLLFYAIPTLLVATCIAVCYWRRPAHIGPGIRVVIAQTITMFALSLAAGAVLLLLAWLVSLALRRRLAHKLECFFGPLLVIFSLEAVAILKQEFHYMLNERALARMDAAWDAANPKTADDVRTLFGDPDTELDFPDNDIHLWIYYPSRGPDQHLFPYRVGFAPDGTIVLHATAFH